MFQILDRRGKSDSDYRIFLSFRILTLGCHREANVNSMETKMGQQLAVVKKQNKKAQRIRMRKWMSRHSQHGLPILQREMEAGFFMSVLIYVDSRMLNTVSLKGCNVSRCWATQFATLTRLSHWLSWSRLENTQDIRILHPKYQIWLKWIRAAPMTLGTFWKVQDWKCKPIRRPANLGRTSLQTKVQTPLVSHN